MIASSGQFSYTASTDWAKLPTGWSFTEVGVVGVRQRLQDPKRQRVASLGVLLYFLPTFR
jgi:hypothetical protein